MLVLLLLLQTATCQADIDFQPSDSIIESQWTLFRASRPYLAQTVALGSPTEDGSRVLIVSEPPPHVSVARLQALAPTVFGDLHICRQRFGFNGWAKDVVIRLPATVSRQALDEALGQLQLYLFGTTYKAYVEDLHATASILPASQLDLKVTSSDLRRWVIEEGERFRTRPDESGTALLTILRSGRVGVFYSAARGLVAWVVSRRGDLTQKRRDARQFVLDSDVILGAFATPSYVAVIGRERVIPVRRLPPLRVETIIRLASARTAHLAQSYERTFLFAGRYADWDDWAPIYLSPDLIDTEYGSLLNLTDQLLKSWSEGGNIRYDGFEYNNPNGWPFPRPLMRYLGSSSLTYNWNTAGTGYIDHRPGVDVYALHRSGALPVSYLSTKGDSVVAATVAEDAAGEFFATCNDPNIVRVVQYAAFYQIWKAFGVRAIEPPPPQPPDYGLSLQSLLVERLDQIRLANYDTVDTEADSLLAGYLKKIRAVQSALRLLHEEFGEDVMDQLAERLLARRGNQDSAEARKRAFVALRDSVRYRDGRERPTATGAQRMAYWSQVVAPNIRETISISFRRSTRDVARMLYLLATFRPDSGWIRTGTVVVSWDADTVENAVGGHNLDAAVTQFRASAAQPPGRVRVITERGQRVILVNERDLPRIAQETKLAARNVDNFQVELSLNGRLASTMPAPARPRTTALNLTPEQPAAEGVRVRGFTPEATEALSGYGPAARFPSMDELASIRTFENQRVPFVQVTRLPDGSFEVVGPAGVTRATSSTSALEAALFNAGGGSGLIPIQLRGVSLADANGFRTNALATLRRNARAPDGLLVVAPRDVTSDMTLQRLAAPVDLGQVSVGDIVPNALGEFTFTLEMRAPAGAAAPRTSLLTRITVSVRKNFIAPTREWVTSVVRGLVGAPTRRSEMLYRAVGRIQAALERANPNIESVQMEMGDVWIGRVKPPSASLGTGSDVAQ